MDDPRDFGPFSPQFHRAPSSIQPNQPSSRTKKLPPPHLHTDAQVAAWFQYAHNNGMTVHINLEPFIWEYDRIRRSTCRSAEVNNNPCQHTATNSQQNNVDTTNSKEYIDRIYDIKIHRRTRIHRTISQHSRPRHFRIVRSSYPTDFPALRKKLSNDEKVHLHLITDWAEAISASYNHPVVPVSHTVYRFHDYVPK